MADLRWDDVRCFFDPDLMGALPDLHVPDTATGDWQALFDSVASESLQHEYTEGCAVLPLPSAQEVLSRPADAESVLLRVWVTPVMTANFWFLTEDRIDFDIDARAVHGQQDLDNLCAFLIHLGRLLRKPVLMDAEGGDGSRPVLGYVPAHDRVRLLGIRR